MKNRLKEWREKRGYTQEQFADIVGLARNTIISIEKGKQGFTDKNKEKFAKVLDCTEMDLMVLDENNKLNYDLNSAKIKGYVQAGQWGEAMEILPEEDQTALPIPINFPYKNVYGLLVKGDSMNMEYNEGDQLLCVEMWEYGEENIIPGDHIIVKAVSHAGEYETTVKEYWKDEFGHAWLIPRSTERKYERYPIPNGDDIDVVINGKRIQNIIMEAYVYSSTRVRRKP